MYEEMKSHFDKVITGGYPNSSSFDPVRDIFEVAFDRKINLFEIVHTNLSTKTNQINGIVTLVGPETEDVLPSGLMAYGSSVVNVNILNEDIYKGLYEDTVIDYIDNVFDAMNNIVKFDSFYVNNSIAKNNPHCVFVKAAPIYYTFHHLNEVAPNYLDMCEKLFKEKLEKYLMLFGKDVDIIYDNLYKSDYSDNESNIYKVMTNEGKIIAL